MIRWLFIDTRTQNMRRSVVISMFTILSLILLLFIAEISILVAGAYGVTPPDWMVAVFGSARQFVTDTINGR